MSTSTLPIQEINGAALSTDQNHYLSGFFAGLSQRGYRFSDLAPMPGAPSAPAQNLDDLIFEERVKRELHPLDAYQDLLDSARANRAPDKEEIYRFKWNGLFFLAPVHDKYMARIRVPGGVLKSFQLREVAKTAKELTSGYIQITTRANLQIRLIEPKNTPEFLRRIQGVGLHTRGAGADNVRNLTANPTSGVDPVELIDVLPMVNEMAQTILNDRVYSDLPRKFNIAYDGGGLIGSVEDTNDLGAKAVKVGDRIMFRIAVGGATGHKAFANDVGILVKPEDLNTVIGAFTKVYIQKGCRTDRKKARLKHLLEKMSHEEYIVEAEKIAGFKFERAPFDPQEMLYPSQDIAHSHVGAYPQKQKGFHYVGATVPVGQLTPKNLVRIAELADLYGSGEIRLTVWQNFIIPNVPDAYVETLKRALTKAGFETKQNHITSGVIACTGSRYCKFAQSDTKAHALATMAYLRKKLEIDAPVNIHFTGCPNSCAQHYMGDIGLLGTKVKRSGESMEGYHICVGGGFGKNQAVGRQVFTSIPHDELPALLEKMLRGWMTHRQAGESFQAFTQRHDLNALQVMFS